MKISLLKIFAFACTALFSASCASLPASGKNPWAPPEKKKSFSERWEEKSAKEKPAETPKTPSTVVAKPALERAPERAHAPATAVSQTRKIADIVFVNPAEKIAVGYQINTAGIVPAKGDIFAILGKDMALRGVARLDIIDGITLGFAVTAGTASTGDSAVIPSDALADEISKKFPDKNAPEPKEN